MMIVKSVIVVVLCIVIALYLHEYHESTIIELGKSFPYLDSSVAGLHEIFKLFDNYVTNERRNILETGENNDNTQDEQLFTADDLKKYTNDRTGLYLALLGKVYDVSEGNKYYGRGGGYHFFTGRDGSRAFVTGDFSESGLTDHVIDLTLQDLRSLSDWTKLYERQYKYKGKVVGRYYDSAGRPTDYQLAVEQRIEEAKEENVAAEKIKLLFPPCNMEWSQEAGSRVWCTKMSGGIKRDWIGVPRKFYEPGSETFRCACVNMNSNQSYMKGNLREYLDCHPKATSCNVYA